MLADILETGTAIIRWDAKLSAFLGFLLIFVLTRTITSIRSVIALRRTKDGRPPPIAPYSVPVLGNLYPFAFDTKRFLGGLIQGYGRAPVRIKILGRKLHFVSGPENVLALFKGSRELTTVPTSILVLENAFGSPIEDRIAFERDNTGIFPDPLPGSNPIEEHNRMFRNLHKLLHRDLQGNSLVDLARRFMEGMEKELLELKVSEDGWTEVPDLYTIVRKAVFVSSTTAIYGAHIFRLNPSFNEDFWEFDRCLPNMFKLLPRWLVPGSYRIRDKMLDCIEKWHLFVAEKVDAADPSLVDVEWEEHYGARLMRSRKIMYNAIENYSHRGMVANDLGMLWGANANIVPLVGWEIFDIIRRPELLQQVRNEIKHSCDATKTNLAEALDFPKLMSSPLLQSIYTEELRLRTGLLVQRTTINDNFKIGGWLYPKDKMVAVSSWHEARDRNVWNEGPVKGEFHSVEDFWAERFLMYSNDPNSGPRKPGPESKLKVPKSSETSEGDKPIFTNVPVTGSFIPYGGGEKICPGRFYAKQEAIGGLAIFLAMFDIEVVDKKLDPQPDLEYFAFGVLPPKGKFPVRMRRRRLA